MVHGSHLCLLDGNLVGPRMDRNPTSGAGEAWAEGGCVIWHRGTQRTSCARGNCWQVRGAELGTSGEGLLELRQCCTWASAVNCLLSSLPPSQNVSGRGKTRFSSQSRMLPAGSPSLFCTCKAIQSCVDFSTSGNLRTLRGVLLWEEIAPAGLCLLLASSD